MLSAIPRREARHRAATVALVLGAALGAATLLRLPAAWQSGNALNHVSGAWMALADDLAHGILYRPLYDPALGYGGTRFFPLSFALHAALVRAGLPLLGAGELLSLAAGLAAALGAASFLRRAGHRPWPAAALAALPLAGLAGQLALSAVRGDLPALALSLWGLSCLLPHRPAVRGGSFAWAASLFVLAFLAKPTSLAAAAAGAVFLALSGRPRSALRLSLGVCAGCTAGIIAIDLLSGGRFLAMMLDWGPGGAGAADLLRAPIRLADRLIREDPAGIALLAAAVVALPLRRLRAGEGGPMLLAALWLCFSLLASLAVMASPGTGFNHLLDLEAASALVLGVSLARPSPAPARAAAAVAAAAGLLVVYTAWRNDHALSRLAEIRTAASGAAGASSAPLLSEDPLLPLSAGERPFLLDAWMLRLAAARHPDLARPLLDELRRGGFRALVLLHGVNEPGADDWFSRQLGPAALAEIRARWRLTLTAGPYHVYRFEPDPGAPPGPGPGHGPGPG